MILEPPGKKISIKHIALSRVANSVFSKGDSRGGEGGGFSQVRAGWGGGVNAV